MIWTLLAFACAPEPELIDTASLAEADDKAVYMVKATVRDLRDCCTASGNATPYGLCDGKQSACEACGGRLSTGGLCIITSDD